MIKTLINSWKVPDLRKKLLFTIFIIIVFRIGSVIPVPFLNVEALAGLMGSLGENGAVLAFLDTISGGAFAQATIFAMSVSPYINFLRPSSPSFCRDSRYGRATVIS